MIITMMVIMTLMMTTIKKNDSRTNVMSETFHITDKYFWTILSFPDFFTVGNRKARIVGYNDSFIDT